VCSLWQQKKKQVNFARLSQLKGKKLKAIWILDWGPVFFSHLTQLEFPHKDIATIVRQLFVRKANVKVYGTIFY